MLTQAQKKALREEFERIQATLPELPKPLAIRTGCKVSWYEFGTEAEARAASEHAKLQAEYYSYLGYDFGYFMGGEVRLLPDGRWEVVFP